MDFLKMRVYRRRLAVSLTVLAFLCVLLCLLICHAILNSQVNLFRVEARRAFTATENDLDLYIAEIDRYLSELYENKGLAEDLELFLYSRSEEEYLTARLDKSTYGGLPPSVIDYLRAIAVRDSRPLFLQISLHTDEFANVLCLEESNGISYGVSNNDGRFANDVTRGISHVRKLVSKDRVDSYIGEIRFLLSADRIFNSAARYGVLDMAVAYAWDTDGKFYDMSGNLQKTVYDGILSGERSEGKYFTGFLGEVYYEIFTSVPHGYRLIAAKTFSAVADDSMQMLVLVCFAAAAVFSGMTFIISKNMRQDAGFLRRIIDTIGQAKTGRFADLYDMPVRNNEYGLISSELNDMCRKLDEHIQREYVLKLRQKEMEMEALQHQINPHFLYNTLEIIRSLAVTGDGQAAADAITCLGKMYRGLVKDEPVITMEQELALLRSYLQLMELRYDGGFCYQLDVEDGVLGLDTVKFWMQPLAENFFRHGYDKNSRYNLLVVTGRELHDRYVIEIMNNGKPVPKEELAHLNLFFFGRAEDTGGSVGVINVFNRLRHFYGKRVSMKLRNHSSGGVSLTVTINFCAETTH